MAFRGKIVSLWYVGVLVLYVCVYAQGEGGFATVCVCAYGDRMCAMVYCVS